MSHRGDSTGSDADDASTGGLTRRTGALVQHAHSSTEAADSDGAEQIHSSPSKLLQAARKKRKQRAVGCCARCTALLQSLAHQPSLLFQPRRLFRLAAARAHGDDSQRKANEGDGAREHDEAALQALQLSAAAAAAAALPPERELTPEEQLLVKLEAREYDDALQLAKEHHLSTDVVYQARWVASPAITPHALQAFLAPIEDDWWVLQNIVQRLYDGRSDAQGLQLLLQWALDFTSTERIQRIRERHAEQAAAVSAAAADSSSAEGKDADADREQQEQQQQHPTSAPDSDSGAPSAVELDETMLCLHRLLFLHTLDRVRLFVAMQEAMTMETSANPAFADISASSSSFASFLPSAATSSSSSFMLPPPQLPLTLDVFLDCDLVSAAVSLASEAHFGALQILFACSTSDELWLARREILAAVPDTQDPRTYVHLLLPLPGVTVAQYEQSVERMMQQHAPELSEEDGADTAGAGAGGTVEPSSSLATLLRSIRRPRDWVEDEELLSMMLSLCRRAEQSGSLFTSPYDLASLQARLEARAARKQGALDLKAEQAREWYAARIRSIDARSGQLNHAQTLLSHARSVLRVPGLAEDEAVLAELTTLVYSYGLDKLSLAEYAALDEFQRLCRVMRDTTPKTVVHDLQNKARLFFDRSTGSSSSATDPDDPFVLSPRTSPLLRRYMLHVATTAGRFDLVHAIIYSSRPGAAKQHAAASSTSSSSSSEANAATSSSPSSDEFRPLIPDFADLVSLSLECCYGSSSSIHDPAPDRETLQLLNGIFECLPARSHADSARMQRLQRYVDELDCHLSALEMLSKYPPTCARPLYFFLTLPASTPDAHELQRWGPARAAHEDQRALAQRWARKHPSLKRRSVPPVRVEEQCVHLLEAMARSGTKRRSAAAPPLSDEGWHGLLRDMLELRLKIFPFISAKQVHELLLRTILGCERWELSKELLRSLTSGHASAVVESDLGSGPLLPLADAEQLVLDKAREFVNSAASMRDSSLAAAKACLNILPIHDATTAASSSSSFAAQATSSSLVRNNSEDSVSSLDDASLHPSLNQLSSPSLTQAWQAEFELLDGLARLEQLGVNNLVPLEIRLARDKQRQKQQKQQHSHPSSIGDSGPSSDVIQGADIDDSASTSSVLNLLLRSNPQLCHHGSGVLDVLRSLGFASDEEQVAAKLTLAEAAMDQGDYRTSMELLLTLLEHAPPSDTQQRAQASELCHKLAQQLNFPAVPSGHQRNNSIIGSGPSLLKPKLHLLAHTLSTCGDAEKLSVYLAEHQQLSQQLTSSTSTSHAPSVRSSARRKPTSSSSRGVSPHSESSDVESPEPVAASLSDDDDAGGAGGGATSNASSATALMSDEDDAALLTAVERTIAATFAGQSFSATGAAEQQQRLGAIVAEVSSSNNGSIDMELTPDQGVNVQADADAALLHLCAETCGVDSTLALSYLLSLSDPMRARSLLDARIASAENGTSGSGGRSAIDATSAFADESSSWHSLPPLNEAHRQQCVEVAMRFFGIVALLAPHTPEVIDKANRHLSDINEGEARRQQQQQQRAGPLSNNSGAVLQRWSVPPLAVLSDCSLDTMQLYLEPLHSAYKSLQERSTSYSPGPALAAILGSAPGASPSALVSSALHYNTLRLEAKKNEFMLLHCPELDVARFTSDAQYRLESIRQLARLGEGEADDEGDDEEESKEDAGDDAHMSPSKRLGLAVALCKRYHLPVWEAYMERACSLFAKSSLSISQLRGALEPFKSDQLLSQPLATYSALVGRVWPVLIGTDLARLSLLVELCLECFASLLRAFHAASSTFTSLSKKKSLVLWERNRARLLEHKELLDKLATIQTQAVAAAGAGALTATASSATTSAAADPRLDYKLLLHSPQACVAELRKLLTEHNIFLVSRLCSKIQHLIQCQCNEAASRGAHPGSIHAAQPTDAASVAGATITDQQPATSAAASINVGLFPVLKPEGYSADCSNLADVLYDLPPVAPVGPAPNMTASSSGSRSVEDELAAVDDGSSSASDDVSPLRIDSSLLFMLFLSTSLRKHMDLLVAVATTTAHARRPSAAAAASVAALPTVQAWFLHYDKLLKRLSVPHFTRFVCEVATAGASASVSAAEPVVGFSLHPNKSELRLRLEVTQCALRLMEQLPAWSGSSGGNGAASSTSSSAVASPLQPQRAVSVDLDASPPLSLDAKLTLFDRVVDAHALLCILAAVFEVSGGCLNETRWWPMLVRTRGKPVDLHQLILRLLGSVAVEFTSNRKPAQPTPADCVHIIDKIRVQLDSVEYRSRQRQAQVEQDERRFAWRFFPLLQLACSRCLQANDFVPGPRSFNASDSVRDLVNAARLSNDEKTGADPRADDGAVVSAASACQLLTAFSAQLSEEHNVALIQLLLTCITAPFEAAPELQQQTATSLVEAQVRHVHMQLRVVHDIQQLQHVAASSSSASALPLHQTLREQVAGSAGLCSSLARSSHVHLLLLRAALLMAPGAANPPSVLGDLAAKLTKPRNRDRSAAIEAVWRLLDSKHTLSSSSFDAQLAASTSLAAVLFVCRDDGDSAADAAWPALLLQLARRGQSQLLLRLLEGDDDGSDGSIPPVSQLLDATAARALYRSLLSLPDPTSSSASSSSSSSSPSAARSSLLLAVEAALTFPPSSPLPRLAVHQLAQFLSLRADQPLSAGIPADSVLSPSPRLLAGLLRHAEVSVPTLLVLQSAAESDGGLLQLLLDHASHLWRQQQQHSPSAVCGPGSVPHLVSLLVCGQQIPRALAVWTRAHQTNPLLMLVTSALSSSQNVQRNVLRTALQQARAARQGQGQEEPAVMARYEEALRMLDEQE